MIYRDIKKARKYWRYKKKLAITKKSQIEVCSHAEVRLEYGEGQRGFLVVPQEDRDRIHNSSLDTSIPYIYTLPYTRARPCTSLCERLSHAPTSSQIKTMYQFRGIRLRRDQKEKEENRRSYNEKKKGYEIERNEEEHTRAYGEKTMYIYIYTYI